MSYETYDCSPVVAEGFFAVYVKPDLTGAERQAAVSNLISILQSVYAHGMNHGQMEFTSKLVKAIGGRKEIPASELNTLASTL